MISTTLKRAALRQWLLDRCQLIATGGGKEVRTPDFQLAKLALYQLSYTPRLVWWAYLDSNQRPPAYQAGALTN